MLSSNPIALTPGTIVAAGAQASRQLHRDYDRARQAEGRAVWDSPDILPRDAWMRRMWQECAWKDPAGTPVLLTRWQELALWEESIASIERDILLNSSATAGMAAQAWELLHSWVYMGEAPLDLTAFDASEDSEAFRSWMSRVRKKLRELNWITRAELPAALCLRVGFDVAFAAAPVTIFGFDELSPADRRLFDACGVHEVGPRAVSSAVSSQISQIACRDAADEWTRAAAWARETLERQPDAQIGILIPGLAPVAATVERIFDDVLHPSFGFAEQDCGGRKAFATCAGESLATCPMTAAALAILRVIHGLPREEAAPLWRSPFLGLDAEEGAKLDVELRRKNAEDVRLTMHPVERRFPLSAAAARALPERARPSVWSGEFSRLLKSAGWPGPRTLTSQEYQTLESWKELLSEFAQLDIVMDSLSCAAAVSRLERMATASTTPSHADSEPVQILDLAHSEGTRFDALWISGLHAAAWPQRAKPNPFLPLALQRRTGMPGSSADREFEAAKRVADRLFCAAPEVVCSYPAHAADEDQQPSPFIAALPILQESYAADTAASRVFAMAPRLEPRPVEENLSLPEGTAQRGGSRVLADQSACPFRAFAVHRLHARELDEPDVGLSALDRGNLAHRVLELLWDDLQMQASLLVLPSEELERRSRSCVERALQEYVAKQEPSVALETFRHLEQGRLEGLVRRWLEIERGRPPFRVIHREKKRSVNVEGLQLELRVDRIDQYDGDEGDGAHAIIDYKTSKQLKTDMWFGERPEAPQLPLYAVTSDLRISEIAFGQLTTASVEWKAVQGVELQEHLPQWRAVVHQLARDFREGHAEVDPREKPNPCEQCKLHALCRVRELRLATHGENNDE